MSAARRPRSAHLERPAWAVEGGSRTPECEAVTSSPLATSRENRQSVPVYNDTRLSSFKRAWNSARYTSMNIS
jgi:hypothetical protein